MDKPSSTTPNALRATNTPSAMTAKEIRALERLLEVAKNDTGQSRRVADFLLAWWNAPECGAWDPTDLWSLDTDLGEAIVIVLGYMLRARLYPDKLGFEDEFKALVRQWRKRTED